MREKFDRDLERLNERLLEMVTLSERAIDKAVTLIDVENELVRREVYNLEEEIDSMENLIQSDCLRMIVEQQPVASDLRTITAALKMITDLERIGDQARDIAEVTKNLNHKYDFEDIDGIEKMANATTKIVKESVDSFVNKDLKAAKTIREKDDIVDDLFVELRNKLTKHIEEGHPDSANIVDLIIIIKYLERIADHAVNISEWVIFSIEG
ncbi:phosphate signaling complex protein PhoU [Peptoniphilus obesi]|uniref:phosphate signaling complex protein PhoU n=1 Tax=Peptoniphilus obesi TaxID=1472765 RepID=UPI0004B1D995|nr:phosphate signaling complex protein PhoU [Peptoniphilus obesi]